MDQAPRTVEQTILTSQAVAAVLAQKMLAYRRLAPRWSPSPVRGTDIAVGIRVFHAKFGEGKVLTVEGVGADARAQINFPRHGVKWLALGRGQADCGGRLTPVRHPGVAGLWGRDVCHGRWASLRYTEKHCFAVVPTP